MILEFVLQINAAGWENTCVRYTMRIMFKLLDIIVICKLDTNHESSHFAKL